MTTKPLVLPQRPTAEGTAPAPARITIRGTARTARRFAAPRAVRRASGPLGLVLLWFLTSATGLLPESVLASPVDVVQQAVELTRNGELPDAIAASGRRAATGFLIGATVALSLSLLAGLFRHDVTFRAVEVAYEQVIGLAPYGPAAEQDNRAGAAVHLPLAALYLGVARAAQAFFRIFAHERVPANLGHPVARTERFRAAAGEIEVLLTAAEELVFGGAAKVDAGDSSYTPEQALGARVLADRHGVRAVELAVRLLGNPGLARGNPLERHFRDIQCAPVHAPQADIALLAIGSKALGL
jgi:hypothetical protein